jgi:hypothetical protein
MSAGEKTTSHGHDSVLDGIFSSSSLFGLYFLVSEPMEKLVVEQLERFVQRSVHFFTVSAGIIHAQCLNVLVPFRSRAIAIAFKIRLSIQRS